MITVLYFRHLGQYVNRMFLQGAQRFARMKGWNLRVIANDDCRSLDEIIDFWHPVGCILEDSSEDGDAYLCDSCALPVVAIDGRNVPGGKNRFRIMHDSVATGKFAAKELLALGFDRFAFVGFHRGGFWSAARESGFREALKLNGKCCLSFPERGRSEWKNEELVQWLRDLPKPCAIFASNDETGATVLSSCARLDIAVPDEVAVLGVDDEESLCMTTTPTLSSIHTDVEQGGYMAAELLDERLRNPSLKPRIRMFGPVMAVNRASTSSVRKTNPYVRKGLDYIKDHIGGCLTVPDVARAMGCSERLAELRFREVLGRSIRDEIQNVRLDRVFFYLRCTQRSLGSIANFVGLGDPASLRRFFRRKTGQSLGDWRRDSTEIA